MYGENGPPPPKQKRAGKLAALFADDSDDESSSPTPSLPPPPVTLAQKPWLTEFNQYLNGNDELPEDMKLCHWWGVSSIPSGWGA